MIASTLETLETTHRPKLLMQAAKYGRSLYKRDRDLPIILGGISTDTILGRVQALIEKEHTLNEKRRQNDADYFVQDHVNCLAALLAESYVLMQSAAPQTLDKAVGH